MTLSNDQPTPEPAPAKVSRQGQGGGPKTAFGKAASCKNSTTHGLSARSPAQLPDVFQDDLDQRMTFYVAHEQPQTDDDMALCGLAALGFVQHREAIAEKQAYLKSRSYQAQAAWDVDRIAEAAVLGARISKQPETVAAELARTLHGSIWLLDHWKYLAGCLDAAGLWNEEETALAHDLLGRGRLIRQGDPDRIVAGGLEVCRALAAGKIQALEKKIAGPLTALDAARRGMAVLGECYLDEPVFRRLNTYENRALRLNRNSLAELERRRTARGIDAYNPDGTIATPPDPHADPLDAEPDPNYQPVFYLPIPDEPPAEPRTEPVAPPRPAERSAPAPAPNEPAEARRPTPDEVRAQIQEAKRRIREERERAQQRATKTSRNRVRASRKRNR